MIRILDKVPMILTKDTLFVSMITKAGEGAIILLPQDAVLVIPPDAQDAQRLKESSGESLTSKKASQSAQSGL